MIPEINLSLLKNIPQPNVQVELRIEPLAPLSMVNELSGSFYKTLKFPDKKMICGLLENVLGWHIDWSDRKKIVKDIEKSRKRKKNKIEFGDQIKGSTYVPLLIDYFEVTDAIKIEFTEVCFFDDLWSRSYRRADAVVHAKGTDNIDYKLIPQKWMLRRDEKDQQKLDSKAFEEFFKENIGKFPMYYSTPTIREYIHLNGSYIIPLLMDVELFSILNKKLKTNNIGYLGNSEGWVNLKLIQL
ncbi:MAG: type I-PGING CRISPR-associated protein Cas5p [Bacteroidales bacterium]